MRIIKEARLGEELNAKVSAAGFAFPVQLGLAAKEAKALRQLVKFVVSHQMFPLFSYGDVAYGDVGEVLKKTGIKNISYFLQSMKNKRILVRPRWGVWGLSPGFINCVLGRKAVPEELAMQLRQPPEELLPLWRCIQNAKGESDSLLLTQELMIQMINSLKISQRAFWENLRQLDQSRYIKRAGRQGKAVVITFPSQDETLEEELEPEEAETEPGVDSQALEERPPNASSMRITTFLQWIEEEIVQLEKKIDELQKEREEKLLLVSLLRQYL